MKEGGENEEGKEQDQICTWKVGELPRHPESSHFASRLCQGWQIGFHLKTNKCFVEPIRGSDGRRVLRRQADFERVTPEAGVPTRTSRRSGSQDVVFLETDSSGGKEGTSDALPHIWELSSQMFTHKFSSKHNRTPFPSPPNRPLSFHWR